MVLIYMYVHCTDACSPGTFSPTGIVPCSPCPWGTYAEAWGSKACTECPVGLNTASISSNSPSACMGKSQACRHTKESTINCDSTSVYFVSGNFMFSGTCMYSRFRIYAKLNTFGWLMTMCIDLCFFVNHSQLTT